MGKENIVVYAEADQLKHNGLAGCYSLKFNFSGKTFYNFEGKHFRISSNNYLFLNDGQFYTCENEVNSKIRSLIIFFSKSFFTQSVSTSIQSSEKLLDNVDFCSNGTINFFQKITTPSTTTYDILSSVAESVSFEDDAFYIDELLHQLLGELTIEQLDYKKEIDNQPAQKRSTKVELFKRASIARDYIISNYHQQIGLEDLSRLVHMAPHHFLRTFKYNYRQTPYHFITELRLKEAKNLLRTETISISEISEKVGFQNLTSFTRLFTKYIKTSPSSYRKWQE